MNTETSAMFKDAIAHTCSKDVFGKTFDFRVASTEDDFKKVNTLAKERDLGFEMGLMEMVDGSTTYVNGLVPFARGSVKKSEFWTTFIVEVKKKVNCLNFKF